MFAQGTIFHLTANPILIPRKFDRLMFQGITVTITKGKRMELVKQITLKAEVAAHNQEHRRQVLKSKIHGLTSQHEANIAEKVRHKSLFGSPFKCDLVPAANSSTRGSGSTTLVVLTMTFGMSLVRWNVRVFSGCTLSGCIQSIHVDTW